MTRAELKARARKQLGGSIFQDAWLMALLVDAAFAFIISLAAGFGAGIVSLVITGPMVYGIDRLYLKQAREGGTMNFLELFKGFIEDFGGNLLLGFMMTLFVFLWSLLLVIPGIVAAYSYSMAFYIKNDHPEYGWRECLNASKAMMRGHKAELFVLQLSFLGWWIVGSLALGVGALWVSPYVSATNAQFYEWLRCGE